MKIPRALYQTVSDKTGMHPELVANVQRLQAMHPGWTHHLFDEAQRLAFVREHYGADMVRCYERIDPRYGAARADFFRYLLLFRWGGVYLDIKSTVTRPLDEIIQPDDEYLLSHWHRPDGQIDADVGRHAKDGVEAEFQQWHIASVAGHPFLAAVIDRVCHNIRHYNPRDGKVGARGVFKTTGPVCYTLAIEPLLHSAKHRMINSDAQGFRYSCLSADPGADRHRRILPNYRELRFPLVRPERPTWRALALHLAYTAFGHVNAVLIRWQIPQTLVRWKKAMRARRARNK